MSSGAIKKYLAEVGSGYSWCELKTSALPRPSLLSTIVLKSVVNRCPFEQSGISRGASQAGWHSPTRSSGTSTNEDHLAVALKQLQGRSE